MATGLVFNIQRYSIHDGPGIRTTVFLKGCPLRCWWCHNPESQSNAAEVSLVESRCVRCGRCLEVCPNADQAAADRLPFVDRQRCIGCGECVRVCPTAARELVGRPLTVAEALVEVLKDRIFFEESGGGMTLSGGEPLLQAEFARELLTACRREEIHTAVDTCGFVRREDLLAIAPVTNLFLYDLKLTDDERHRQFTGVSNVLILDNLRALGQVHDNIWIRVPIVPGFNDAPTDLEATARIAVAQRGVRRVSLLPYHALGRHKSERLGKAAPAESAASPALEHMAALADRLRDRGLPVFVGG